MFGTDGKFELSRVNECPQFRAFVEESLRIGCAGPDGLGRSCDKDIRCVKYKQYDPHNDNYNVTTKCDYIESDVWN